jgi:hypothetical protein
VLKYSLDIKHSAQKELDALDDTLFARTLHTGARSTERARAAGHILEDGAAPEKLRRQVYDGNGARAYDEKGLKVSTI